MDNKKIYNLIILKGILIGLLVLLIITAILATIYSLVFTFSTIILNKILIVISLIIVIYIGIYIAKRVDKFGWLNGGLGGMIFMGIIIILGSLNVSLSLWPVLLVLILGLFLGGIGGIIGINFKSKY